MCNSAEMSIKRIIAEKAKVKASPEDVVESTNLIEEFGYDSIKLLEMVVDLEDFFDIQLDDSELDLEILSVYGSLKGLIESKI